MLPIRVPFLTALAAVLTLAACGGEQAPSAGADGASPTEQASASQTAGGEQTPDAGGQVITVEMLTDDQGNNVFRPAEITARKGDVVRYTLVSGVHNVNFVADSNPNAQGLPTKPGDLLQLPGQTYDLKVVSPPGRYYFHCDPHALLGMIGHLGVQ
ncbi:MAG: plastocyanin/azurin family copper-binding protein [Gemmatirosa sp.]